jgi:hypothetical protein
MRSGRATLFTAVLDKRERAVLAADSRRTARAREAGVVSRVCPQKRHVITMM